MSTTGEGVAVAAPATGMAGRGSRMRWLVLALVAALALGGSVVYLLGASAQRQAASQAPPSVDVAPSAGPSAPPRPETPHIVFINTAAGAGQGTIATVPLADPKAARSLSGVPCERVYANRSSLVCLRAEGLLPGLTRALTVDTAWGVTGGWDLNGVLSRTRVSEPAGHTATTTFVSGHTYASSDFVTETRIRTGAGQDLGNLEDFAITVEGQPLTSPDRNVWGVTFSRSDPDLFYATVASGDRRWLVRGSIAGRSLTSVAADVECPSLSPDGTRIAFKRRVPGLGVAWRLEVMDLSTGQVTGVKERRSIDDQPEWLDDRTVLYGMPRAGNDGSDVWAVDVVADSVPAVAIEYAWSPSVVR